MNIHFISHLQFSKLRNVLYIDIIVLSIICISLIYLYTYIYKYIIIVFFQISRNPLLVPPRYNADLAFKNNGIKTGYENFYIKKGNLNLFPFKDFDYINKKVVCLKCFQKFASKFSYKAHVGTVICVRTYNGPHPIYLKYKNRNIRQFRKKKKKKW